MLQRKISRRIQRRQGAETATTPEAGADDPGASAPTDFDEAYYLDSNPDVAEAISQGVVVGARSHFEQHGRSEGRAPNGAVADHANAAALAARAAATERTLGFDELFYLMANRDVEEAVRNGVFPSGRSHYESAGRAEGRAPNARAIDRANPVALAARQAGQARFDAHQAAAANPYVIDNGDGSSYYPGTGLTIPAPDGGGAGGTGPVAPSAGQEKDGPGKGGEPCEEGGPGDGGQLPGPLPVLSVGLLPGVQNMSVIGTRRFFGQPVVRDEAARQAMASGAAVFVRYGNVCLELPGNEVVVRANDHWVKMPMEVGGNWNANLVIRVVWYESSREVAVIDDKQNEFVHEVTVKTDINPPGRTYHDPIQNADVSLAGVGPNAPKASGRYVVYDNPLDPKSRSVLLPGHLLELNGKPVDGAVGDDPGLKASIDNLGKTQPVFTNIGDALNAHVPGLDAITTSQDEAAKSAYLALNSLRVFRILGGLPDDANVQVGNFEENRYGQLLGEKVTAFKQIAPNGIVTKKRLFEFIGAHIEKWIRDAGGKIEDYLHDASVTGAVVMAGATVACAEAFGGGTAANLFSSIFAQVANDLSDDGSYSSNAVVFTAAAALVGVALTGDLAKGVPYWQEAIASKLHTFALNLGWGSAANRYFTPGGVKVALKEDRSRAGKAARKLFNAYIEFKGLPEQFKIPE